MIDARFVILGAVLSLIGCSFYVSAVLSGTARPNRISWFLWGAMPMIAFLAQIDEGVGMSSILTLSIGLGPMIVFAASFANRQSYWKITPLDLTCGLISVGSISTWLLLDNPTVAIVMVVLADTVAAVPTITKSWHSPHTEKLTYYVLAAANGSIALLTLESWRAIDWLIPAYILAIATTIATIVGLRQRSIAHARLPPITRTSGRNYRRKKAREDVPTPNSS